MSTISFAIIRACCAEQGLHALAVLNPVPTQLPSSGMDTLLSDGVGDMGWLAETKNQRLQPNVMLPSAQALLIVAMPYQPAAGDERLRRARYTAGKDYHNLLRPKLGKIGAALNAKCETTWRHRATCDSAPINERTLALHAGLGWIGRNALLISPDAGTWCLLGTMLTEAPLAAHHPGHGEDRCGSCRACEVRCPTAALRDRRVLSERCISYLTIEHQGVITRDLAQHFEGWWFGCDLCQEVCPWNRFAQAPADPRLFGDERDADLLNVRAETFDTHFAGRAIRRIGYERFRRNLLIALWSLGHGDLCGPLLNEGLPLVLAQARELGIDAAISPIVATDVAPGSPPCA